MADGSGQLGDRVPRVRALFVSDLHLGTRACHAEGLLDLLEGCETETLYLVGDVVDGWRLKARWYWPPSHDAVVRCLLRKQESGTRILYLPGNHDEFLRQSVGLRLGGIEVLDEAVHAAADGSRLLVLHGDRFDPVVRRMRRLARLGIWVYAVSVLTNDAIGRWRRKLRRGGVVESRRRRIAAFEAAAAAEARARGLDGIICGHIHSPAMHERHGTRYINTGDWVEACTAVAEYHDGRIALLHWPFEGALPAADDHAAAWESAA